MINFCRHPMRRQNKLSNLIAPKVQYNLAQGNALGFRYPNNQNALKEQYNRLSFMLPLQGEHYAGGFYPTRWVGLRYTGLSGRNCPWLPTSSVSHATHRTPIFGQPERHNSCRILWRILGRWCSRHRFFWLLYPWTGQIQPFVCTIWGLLYKGLQTPWTENCRKS